MARYKFHELKGKTKLPDDVNRPILDMIGLAWPVEEIKAAILKHQKNKSFGKIDIIDRETGKRMSMNVHYGIIEGCDLVETVETDRFLIHSSKHIKNENVDFKKEKKQ